MPTIYIPPAEPAPPPPTPVPPYGPPTATSPSAPKNKQHWAPDPQQYALDTLVSERDDALWTFGEYVMFVLLWNIRDFQAGLVSRCTTCYTPLGKIADTYGQASKEKCPDCLGTTFSGGFRAKIVRPCIFEDIDPEDKPEVARGALEIGTTNLQTTNDFVMHNQDMVFRANGSRWRMMRPDSMNAYAGFGLKAPNIGWNVATATLDDESSVSYIVEPDTTDLIELLDVKGFRRPLDYSFAEVVRGPL